MRLLDKYILRELLTPLSFCLGGFTMLFVGFSLVKDLDDFKDSKLRAYEIAEYYLTSLPEIFVTILPIALLLALLFTLTNLARHHEISAIRAAGVSLWRLSWPYFGVGITCGFLLFALNEFAVPDATIKGEQIKTRRSTKRTAGMTEVIQNLGFVNTEAKREWLIGSYNVNTAEMGNPRIIWTLADGSQRWLHAARAIRTNGIWLFLDAREYRSDPAISANLVPSLSTNALERAWDETPAQIRSEIKIANRMISRSARAADLPLVEIRNYVRLHPNLPKEDRWWLETKWHGRLAMPWTCLVVVLIALPFGAASGRRNVFVGVAGSILIAFGYLVVTQLGLALGSGGHLPAWLAGWLPNIAFGGVGLWLTSRVR